MVSLFHDVPPVPHPLHTNTCSTPAKTTDRPSFVACSNQYRGKCGRVIARHDRRSPRRGRWRTPASYPAASSATAAARRTTRSSSARTRGTGRALVVSCRVSPGGDFTTAPETLPFSWRTAPLSRVRCVVCVAPQEQPDARDQGAFAYRSMRVLGDNCSERQLRPLDNREAKKNSDAEMGSRRT